MNLRLLFAIGCAMVLSGCGGGGVPPSGNDIAVSGTGPTSAVGGGQTAVFTMTVTNKGPTTASDVLLVNSIGRNLVLQGITCASTGGAACPDAPATSNLIASFPVGAAMTLTVSALVAPGTDGTITNSLSASASGDNDRSNNLATASATADSTNLTGSNLIVTGTGPADPVPGGGVATFTMVVTNTGPEATGDVLIENRPGANSSLNNLTCSAGGGAICPTSLNPTMQATAIPVGGSLSFTVQNNVAKGYNGSISDTMSVTVGKDPDHTNNLFTATGTADSANLTGSNIAVSGTGPSAPIAAGGVATFVMTVTNTGPQDASNVQLINSVGAGAILTGITCSASGGVACPTATGPSMQIAAFPVGGTLQLTVTSQVSAGASSGTVKNTLSALLSGDPDRSNNLFTATGATFSGDLSVTASGPSGNVKSGTVATFTMTVTNLGPDTAQDVAITNQVGDNLTLTSIACAATGGAECPSELGETMTASAIPSGGALVFTVLDTITAGAQGRVSNTMQATAAGDAKPGNNTATASANATSSNLGVSETVAEKVAAGATAFFTATVANAGPNLAQNLVLVHTLPTGYAAGTVSCTALGNAACPATVGATMNLDSLPVGGKLFFTIPVTVPATARGPIAAQWTVTADGDPDTSNNTATAAVTAQDPRSGGYKVFAANGRQYGLTLDFDAGTYTMAGHGLQITGSFNADAAQGGFLITGNQRFRVSGDLVSGGFDFGAGVRPYVAARRFATALTDLAGAFNVSALSVPTTGGASSRVLASRFIDNTYQVCTDATQVYSMASCPSASVWTYTLSVANGVFTGTDATHGDILSFYVAKTGSSLVYLSAGDAGDGGSSAFRLGVPDVDVIGGNSFGASTLGSWDAVTLSPSVYSVSAIAQDGGAFSDTASIALLTSGPAGLRSGLRNADRARIYVMQASGLTVVTGSRSGAANGVMEISAP